MYLGNLLGFGFGPILLLVEILLCIHVYRTGRPYYWIWIIIIAPALGCLAYALVELLPELRGLQLRGVSYSAWVPRSVIARRLETELEERDTVELRLALADLYSGMGRYEDACAMASDCLRGAFRDDPHTLAAIARHKIEAGRHAEAEALLQGVVPKQDRMVVAELTLLRGRIALGLGRHGEAAALFRSLEGAHLGEEPRYHLAQALLAAGDAEGARTLFEDISRKYRRSTRLWRRAEVRWFKLSRKALKSLSAA